MNPKIIITSTPIGNNWLYEYYVKEDEYKALKIDVEDSEIVNWVLYRLKLKIVNGKMHDDTKKLMIEIEEVEQNEYI
jgi:hypothetical protein